MSSGVTPSIFSGGYIAATSRHRCREGEIVSSGSLGRGAGSGGKHKNCFNYEKKKKIKSVAARGILKNCFLPFQGKEEGIPWHVALLLLEDSHTLHREEEHPSEYTCKEGSIRVPCQKMREQVCLPFRTMNTTEFISLINSP